MEEAVQAARAHVHDRAWQFLERKADLIRRLQKFGIDDERAAAAPQWALDVELLVSG
ncbi:hypothetical protein [Streptomyces sp. cg2]|uniref:hypothetical protein n=1 Tax=Streptomyces sp. cg2 TaxID=3238799 RepID=UPI0034E1A9A3